MSGEIAASRGSAKNLSALGAVTSASSSARSCSRGLRLPTKNWSSPAPGCKAEEEAQGLEHARSVLRIVRAFDGPIPLARLATQLFLQSAKAKVSLSFSSELECRQQQPRWTSNSLSLACMHTLSPGACDKQVRKGTMCTQRLCDKPCPYGFTRRCFNPNWGESETQIDPQHDNARGEKDRGTGKTAPGGSKVE